MRVAHKTKDGTRRYRVVYEAVGPDGMKRRERRVIGTKPMAELARSRLQLEAQEALALGRRPVGRATWGDLSRLHLGRAMSAQRLRRVRQRWELIHEFFPRTRPLGEVRPQEIAQFRAWFLSLPARLRPGEEARLTEALRTGIDPWGDRRLRSPDSANHYVAILHTAMKMAVANDLVRKNPVDATHYARIAPRDRVPEGNEFSRMLAVADPELRLAAMIACETALRQASIAELVPSRVHLDDRYIFVGRTKAGVPAMAPISVHLAERLREWIARKPNAPLFTISSNLMAQRWMRLRAQLGIEGLRFHDLRREAASRMLAAGIPIDVVGFIGGWKKFDTLLRIYARVNSARVRSARAALDAYYSAKSE